MTDSKDLIIDGVPAAKWIDDFNAHTERWGNLASGTVPRRDVRKAILYLESLYGDARNECKEITDTLETRIQELRNELTAANRRLAASKAREAKLKKQLSTDEEVKNDE